ncbi:hypothetical protein U8335_20740 [Roseiconus lacunae]|uniref:Uncharacterized protein n=1 Tax=Roseiconus lacunae TaxID=2605694 RepID=A0ABT7PJ25_9BACT|nr:hypothetical protein [Roseiconus lacunae]MDM4016502.1 hypothetical protein [Roseiconus lacunae]WRQ49373.1 hypothetical protein U8335_20740 [Stieleria sp. HD01]
MTNSLCLGGYRTPTEGMEWSKIKRYLLPVSSQGCSMRISQMVAAILLAGSLLDVAPLPAQEVDWHQRFAEQAAKYELSHRESGATFEMLEKPILHYTTPTRMGGDGSVFLWTDQSAPVAIGTCFTYVYQGRTNRKNAFNVLTNQPIKAVYEKQTVWMPPENAIGFKAIPNAPPPAENPRSRETQMRGLSRQFSLEVTNRDGRVEQCRLMSKPLYSYETEDRTGSLFSFAVGTDPEAVLMIEQSADSSGKPQWHYAWARFSFYPLTAKHRGIEVWRKEGSENLRGSLLLRTDYQQERYITFRPEYIEN